jgi:hypothetical protein
METPWGTPTTIRYDEGAEVGYRWLYLDIAFRYAKGAVDVKAATTGAVGCRRSPGFGLTLRPATNVPCLAWLLDVQCGETADSVVEPARPEGLGNCSPALASFVDIFSLNRDLVAVAAAGDTNAPSDPSPRDMERWLASLRADEHVALLSRVARGDGSVGTEILRRFRRHAPRRGPRMPLRTVGELRARAEATAEKRRKTARDREARERERREREQQADRQRYLTGLAQAGTSDVAAGRRTHRHDTSCRRQRRRGAPR